MASHLAFTFGCLLLYTVGTLVLSETGCPPAENIAPCICDNRTSTRLECSNVVDYYTIEQVFKNTARYTFQEVHLRSLSLQHLPSAMFENTRIHELYLENCKLSSLFIKALKTNTLEKLQLDNTTVLQGLFRKDVLKPVTSLKTLVVNGDSGVKVLDAIFSQNLPSSLKEIILHRTGIKKIMPGAFRGLRNLDKLEVSSSKLSALTRDMFPQRFNVRFLYFDNNNLSHLSRHLFTDMPELQFLSMKNNNIVEIPEAAFGYRRQPMLYLGFDGNPLRCNIFMKWLIRNKPEIIEGTCDTPSTLRGKNIQDLLPGDFNYY